MANTKNEQLAQQLWRYYQECEDNEWNIEAIERQISFVFGSAGDDVVPYQLCPKCHGERIVTIMRPMPSSSSASSWPEKISCDICKSEGIIPMHKIPTEIKITEKPMTRVPTPEEMMGKSMTEVLLSGTAGKSDELDFSKIWDKLAEEREKESRKYSGRK